MADHNRRRVEQEDVPVRAAKFLAWLFISILFWIVQFACVFVVAVGEFVTAGINNPAVRRFLVHAWGHVSVFVVELAVNVRDGM